VLKFAIISRFNAHKNTSIYLDICLTMAFTTNCNALLALVSMVAMVQTAAVVIMIPVRTMVEPMVILAIPLVLMMVELAAMLLRLTVEQMAVLPVMIAEQMAILVMEALMVIFLRKKMFLLRFTQPQQPLLILISLIQTRHRHLHILVMVLQKNYTKPMF